MTRGPLTLAAVTLAAAFAGCGADEQREPVSSRVQPATQARTPAPAPAPAATAEQTDTPEPAPAPSPPTATTAAAPRVQTVARGLQVPWDVAFLPDGRALVTERPGRIRLVTRRGGAQRTPVARVAVQAEGEGGLMGIALDPDFADGSPFAYVMATRDGQVRVLRLRWDGRRLRGVGTVLDGITAGSIHDSGRLRFGPDRRLYVVTGDAGRRELAQQRGSLNGKVLSLSPQQYRSSTNSPRIVSVGHRNPQGLDWQPGSRRLFVTEHGPSGFDGPSCCDELNHVVAGGNQAWPRYGRDQRGVARPERLWQRTIAPSGMSFVARRGSAWTGDVLVAALKGTSLRRLPIDGTRVGREQVLFAGRYGRLRAVVEAPDGAIWVTTSNLDQYGSRRSPADDQVLRIVPPR